MPPPLPILTVSKQQLSPADSITATRSPWAPCRLLPHTMLSLTASPAAASAPPCRCADGRVQPCSTPQTAPTHTSLAACQPPHTTLQVLMATRSSEAPRRLQALAVLAGLVERVREEYLVLLPEALPFLAELVEDPEHAVEAATQSLLRRLEELSGESLEHYLKA